MSDAKLHKDIMDELKFDPSLDASHVTIAVDGGVVTIGGSVRKHQDRIAAERAIRRTHGVKAISGHLEVMPNDGDTAAPRLGDSEMAHRALNVLKWDHSIPDGAIQIAVDGGVITLSGEVTWHFERTAAEEAVRRYCSPRNVINNILIKPHAQAENIQEIIEDALRRNSGVDHSDIRVIVRDGSTVVLEGTVGSLDERKAAEEAAWCALGVESVENKLSVSAGKP